MEPTEPIERFPIPPPPPQDNPGPFKKILSVLIGLKDDFISFVKSLANRASYVKVPESDTDQKVHKVWFDASSAPKKSAIKSQDAPQKKQSFSENLTALKTYSSQTEKPLSEEKKHRRRWNEEKSSFRRIGEKTEEEKSSLSNAEKVEDFLIRSSYPNLNQADIEKAFSKAEEGAYLVNKTDDGYAIIIKKNNLYEIHPFRQLRNEDDMPLELIESKGVNHENFKNFITSIGGVPKKPIKPKARFDAYTSDKFLRNLSLEEAKQFLMDKPDRSFTILASDKPDFTYILLIKKEPLLPFFDTTIDVVYYKIDNDDQVVSDKSITYSNFQYFLFDNGTTMGRGQIT